jgi:hypothetical protein
MDPLQCRQGGLAEAAEPMVEHNDATTDPLLRHRSPVEHNDTTMDPLQLHRSPFEHNDTTTDPLQLHQ